MAQTTRSPYILMAIHLTPSLCITTYGNRRPAIQAIKLAFAIWNLSSSWDLDGE